MQVRELVKSNGGQSKRHQQVGMRAMRVMLECAPSLRQSSSRLCEQRGRRRLIDPIQARNRSKRGRDLSRHGGGRWGPGLPGRREKANKRSLAWINSLGGWRRTTAPIGRYQVHPRRLPGYRSRRSSRCETPLTRDSWSTRGCPPPDYAVAWAQATTRRLSIRLLYMLGSSFNPSMPIHLPMVNNAMDCGIGDGIRNKGSMSLDAVWWLFRTSPGAFA